METKKFQSRRLTTVEKEFSKILTIPILRKEYIMRLNNGESLENMEEEFKHRLNEALNAKRQAELVKNNIRNMTRKYWLTLKLPKTIPESGIVGTSHADSL